MADTQPVILPPLAQTLTAALARKALTALSVALVTHGALSNADTSAFIQAGVGIVIGIASLGWTIYQANLNHQRLQVAAQPGIVNAAVSNSQKAAIPLDSVVKSK